MKMPPPLRIQLMSVLSGMLWTSHITKTITSAIMNAQETLLCSHFVTCAISAKIS